MDAELKSYLDAQFEAQRGHLREQLGGLHEQMGGFRGQLGGLHEQMGGFRGQLDGFREQLDGFREQFEGLREEMRQIETNLLTAFHNWARPMEMKQRNASNAVSGFDERLSLVEDRVSRLERKETK